MPPRTFAAPRSLVVHFLSNLLRPLGPQRAASQRFQPRPPRRVRFRLPSHWARTAAAALALAALLPLSAAQAALIGLRETGTGLTTLVASPGATLSVDLFLDTQGLSFEGYAIGVDFTGGSVTGIAVAQEAIGLFPDIFGPPVINDAAGTVRNVNQTTFSGGLPAGVYVLDTLTFSLASYDTPDNELILAPGLFGEALGLGGGSCPGTTAGCSVNFASATVVPEPGSALLLALGLGTLHWASRNPRASRR